MRPDPALPTAPATPPEALPERAQPASARLGSAPGRVLPFEPRGERPGLGETRTGSPMSEADLDRWDDHALIDATRAEPERAPELLDALFRRHHRRVSAWCLRWCNGRVEDAADLAQEVFLRAQEKLDGFRGESAFTTWLYLVTRTVALNRADKARRRPADSLEDQLVDPADPAPAPDEVAAREQLVGRLRHAIATVLEPLEARILHLHHHEGMTLPTIDRLLDLQNKSGAKAYLVSAKRKLQRHLAALNPQEER
jgi:RNA polymerase sigma-70 factor (ECF subfamily)